MTGKFGPDDPVPLDRLAEWIDESYRAVAPKTLVAELDGVAPAAKPARSRKRKP